MVGQVVVVVVVIVVVVMGRNLGIKKPRELWC